MGTNGQPKDAGESLAKVLMDFGKQDKESKALLEDVIAAAMEHLYPEYWAIVQDVRENRDEYNAIIDLYGEGAGTEVVDAWKAMGELIVDNAVAELPPKERVQMFHLPAKMLYIRGIQKGMELAAQGS